MSDERYGVGRQWPVPWSQPNGHWQTIAAALWSRTGGSAERGSRRERWQTPDGDFIDVDRDGPVEADVPLIVVFHGLEGSSNSHYVRALKGVVLKMGWAMAVPHFRGCSGEINLAPRAYHSGDHQEVDWILKKIRSEWAHRNVYAVGVSLGGSALLNWLGRHGIAAHQVLSGVVAVCAPLDLWAAGMAIDRGLNRLLYARAFLKTMIAKAEAKWRQYPGLFDIEAVRRATTLYEFDEHFTAPLHGFSGTREYWEVCSSKAYLKGIRVPSLLINARNDPFVPVDSLPESGQVSAAVTLWRPQQGGHVGFARASGWWDMRGEVQGFAQVVCHWLTHEAGTQHG